MRRRDETGLRPLCYENHVMVGEDAREVFSKSRGYGWREQTREWMARCQRAILRGSAFCVYFNSSLLVLLIFLTFLLSSLFCKTSRLGANSFLHPLICFSLFWVAYARSNYFVKKSVYLRGYARSERQRERRPPLGSQIWQHSE